MKKVFSMLAVLLLMMSANVVGAEENNKENVTTVCTVYAKQVCDFDLEKEKYIWCEQLEEE